MCPELLHKFSLEALEEVGLVAVADRIRFESAIEENKHLLWQEPQEICAGEKTKTPLLKKVMKMPKAEAAAPVQPPQSGLVALPPPSPPAVPLFQ